MRNPKYWRKRTLEQEKERLHRVEREMVFSRISPENDESLDEESVRKIRQVYRELRLGPLPSIFTLKQKRRRLKRKIRRMEKETYRRRNSE